MDTFPTPDPIAPRANAQQPASTLTLARKDLRVHRRAAPLSSIDLSDVNLPARELQQVELVVLRDQTGAEKVLKSRLPMPFVAHAG